jgi:predicted transcriptional regulator
MSKSRRASDQRKGHLELVRGRDDSRPFIHLLMTFLHRADQDRRGLYSGDLDLAAVGLEGQRSVKALTIAEATGIPRETVRRKLKLLVERGVIVEKTRGAYVFKLGYIQQPETLDVIERGMRDTLQFMNDCVKLGLVRWVDDAE